MPTKNLKVFVGLCGLLWALAACMPAAQPRVQVDGEAATIRVHANAPLYGLNLSIVNARTSDDRCVPLEDTNLACHIGFVPEGDTAVLEVERLGDSSCLAFTYLQPTALAYRFYPCRVAD